MNVIVSGGGSGMGAAGARLFVREGASVAVLDLDEQRGAEVVATANRDGPGRARFHRCDVRDRAQVREAFASAVGELGGLDALVNTAGIDRITPAESITEDEWDLVLDINLKGTFHTNQAAFPHLRDRGGRIVNFASSAGLIMFPNHGHYVAAKAGIVAWSRTLAGEWGRFGITVNSLTPFARTPMIEEFEADLGEADKAAFDAHVAAIPLGRLGDPDDDIAPVLLFLLSDASRYITGQIIGVDGGNVPVR